MAGRPKRRAKALTQRELRLLRYPPSPTTWCCRTCDTVNSGSLGECWLCRKTRPKSPNLLWRSYVLACRKVGIDPALRTRWIPGKDTSDKEQSRNTKKRRVARKGT